MMMNNNGYSKISDGHKQSRSMDFSSSVPHTSKPSTNTATEQVVKNQQQTDLDHEQERFREMVLGRSASVSSASGFQATVKRAFSMRRSSSVSESYCRIHDQYMPMGDQIDDDEDHGIRTARSIKKKKLLRGANIFKACKRLLGFGL